MVLLHPFMPFVTEEIWQHLPHEGETIMRTQWPEFNESFLFEKEEKDMAVAMNAIKAIRNTRASMNVPPSKKAKTFIKTSSEDIFKAASYFFVKLSSASEIEFVADESSLPENVVTVVSDDATIYIPVGELVDIEKEKARLLKEKEDLEKEVARVQGKLSNPGFISKAPEKLINEEKEKGIKYQQMLDKVLENLKKL